MFGARQDQVAFTQDRANMKIETKKGTLRYSAISLATMVVSKVSNPFYVDTFTSFEITVYDKDKGKIAQVTTGISYTTTYGSINSVSMLPKNSYIDTKSNLEIKFAPYHSTKLDSKIKIEIPIDMRIGCPTNFDYNSKILKRKMSVTCNTSVDGLFNIVIFNSPYVYPYVFDKAKTLKILLDDSTTPYSARDIKDLKISTLTADDKVIDYYQSAVGKVYFTVKP